MCFNLSRSSLDAAKPQHSEKCEMQTLFLHYKASELQNMLFYNDNAKFKVHKLNVLLSYSQIVSTSLCHLKIFTTYYAREEEKCSAHAEI